MSDVEIPPGGAQPPEPNTYNPLFSVVTPLGAVLAVSTVADEVQPANSGALATAQAIGVCIQKANAAGERGTIRYNGPVTLTAAQWALALVGESELTAGSAYYVSATAGKITKTKPVSGYDTPVGYALSTLTLFVQPGQPIAAD